MNKKSLSEADIRTKFITPAIVGSNGEKWNVMTQIREEAYFTKGRVEPRLVSALAEPWVLALADRLGCPTAALQTVAMRRKLFDDFLMHFGGYLRE